MAVLVNIMKTRGTAAGSSCEESTRVEQEQKTNPPCLPFRDPNFYHLQSDAHIDIRPKPPAFSTVVHRGIPRIEISQRNAVRVGNRPTPVTGLCKVKLLTPAHHAAARLTGRWQAAAGAGIT